jgi:hypothetical protein
MNLSGKIYSKTGKGVKALSSKSRQLSVDSRKILASIDGKTDAETLMEQFQKLPDEAFIMMLTQLEHDGYIKFLKNANWDIDDDLVYTDAMVVDELSPEDFFAITNEVDSEDANQSTEKTRAKQEPPSPSSDEVPEDTSSDNDIPQKADTPQQIDQEALAQTEQLARHDVSAAFEETERRQREETERKAAEESERRARKEEEARQKAEAEAIAKAEKLARQEAERKAREDEEAQKRAEAEARAKAQQEAKLEAERIAREEAERKAAEEAERKALKEEEARQKAEAEAIAKAEKLARQEAERVAKEQAKRKAAEEKALRQKAKDEERAIAAEIAKERAEEKAREKAERRAEKEARRAMRPPPDLGKWLKVAKTALLYSPLALLALVALLQVINLRMLAGPVESYVSELLGEQVTIRDVRISLVPSALTLSGISVESGTDVGIGEIQMSPMVLLQSDKTKELGKIEIEDVMVSSATIGRQMSWAKALANSQDKLSVEEIILEKISFDIPGLELAPFAGKIGTGGDAGIVELESDDGRLQLKFEPVNGTYKVTVNASAWKPPFNTRLEFAELNAEGVVDTQQIRFDEIKAKLYSGSMTANAILVWTGQPSVSGDFDLNGLSIPVTLSSMGVAASVDGTVNVKGSFSGAADLVGKLVDNLAINATFTALNGKINGVNLSSQMVSGSSRSDGATRFDKLTGSVQFKDGYYQYKQLVLESSQFKARGNLDIQPNQDITGKVSGEVATPSRVIRSNLNLSGKVSNVKLN